MFWYLVGGVTIIAVFAIGFMMYYCNKKDKKTHPWSAFATFLIPLLGQLGSRLMTVSSGKGMAQKWLLFPLFFVPPFTAIPAWYVYNDMEMC